MAVDRAPHLDRAFLRLLDTWQEGPAGGDLDGPVRPGCALDGRTALELFESQLVARHLDLEARALKRRGEGYYTIGSSGHEGNVVLGRLFLATDPAFLHYRSGALFVERSRQVPGCTPIFDILLSLVASREDPTSGGRHKVFGSRRLWVPPQTSTIASHLPKAVGAAFAIERGRALALTIDVPHDAIVLCSFGDASANHASAQAAFNAASWAAYQRLPVPIVFVCEDNGIGISVHTPRNWIRARFEDQVGIAYFHGDGLDLPSAYEAAAMAVAHCRSTRRPVFLHLEVARLLGHAGSDVETEYLDLRAIEAQEARDPLLATARLILDNGLLRPSEIRELYEQIRARVGAASREAARRPKLASAEAVMAPLAARSPERVEAEANRMGDDGARRRFFGDEAKLPECTDRPRHLAVQINRALLDALAKYPELLVFGEDVAKKGGVYHVTTGLAKRAGAGRVFNTLLDETTILGLALGAAHIGLLPVPEIQYLAYLHNAEDQVRGEACSLQFFSNGAFRNPMVLRIAAFGYQKGFGGHFHNDNSIAVLRDIPGIVIAAPARGDDAVLMLRTALAAAKIDGAVVAFLEPIALYMTKDLHEEGDGRWLTLYPAPGETAILGRGRVWNAERGRDLTIVSYANGVWLSLRAARVLERDHGIDSRIVDLRWLAPLDRELVLEHAAATGRVLIVDEGRRTGGLGEALVTMIVEGSGERQPALARLAAEDTYIPLGPAANEVLPTEKKIVESALALFEARTSKRRLHS